MEKENISKERLIEISRFYGKNKDYVIAGGGNTSFKNDEYIWIKASGISLADIRDDGFVCLSRQTLNKINTKKYSIIPAERENEIKIDLEASVIKPENLRPSVETSLHNIIEYNYVVHTHPTLVNALMCSQNAKEITGELFGEESVFIDYTDPGYILFKKLLKQIDMFNVKYRKYPKIFFLQNHGIFVASDSIDEIKDIYNKIESVINSRVTESLFINNLKEINTQRADGLNNYFNPKGIIVKGFNSNLIKQFIESKKVFEKVNKPFTPDMIVYCKSHYLFITGDSTDAEIYKKVEDFDRLYNYLPKVIAIKNEGLFIVEETENRISTVLEIFIDAMKISLYSNFFGGPNFMTRKQIEFIDNWEVESYRRTIVIK